jgi:YggT family protein
VIAFILARFTEFVAVALNGLLTLYFWVLIIAAVLSWVNPDPYNPIVRFLRAVTDPVLHQVRRRLPFVAAGGIDFSPLVVILAIQGLQMVVVPTLLRLAAQLNPPAVLPLG